MRKNNTDKWQTEHNQKIHNQKVRNAKSTMSKDTKYKNAKDKEMPESMQRDDTDRKSVYSSGSNLSSYTNDEKTDLTKIPLYSHLKMKGLQQYTKELVSRGYGYYLDG